MSDETKGKNWTVFIRSAIGCLILAIAIFSVSLQRIERVPLSGDELSFDHLQAFDYMKTLAKEYPHRLPWSFNRIEAGHWIEKQLTDMGYETKEMVFSEEIDGKLYTNLRNIYVEKKGTKFPDEIIGVAAHYDTTDTTIEGAMDDASGVGVVLELARIYSQIDSDRTILFLLTDSEEFGAFWGARTFAKTYEKRHQIKAIGNFDFVAPEDQVAILMLSDGLKEGYTPMWLRELALGALHSVGGFEVRDFTNVLEYIQRALLIPPSDHGAFLQNGIPSFNWVGQTANFAHQMAYYHHTAHDVVEAMKPESFYDYGRAAERFLRSLDQLPEIPTDFRNSSYWKITPNYYIDGFWVGLLNLLAFLPFLIYCATKFGTVIRKSNRKLIIQIFLNESKYLFIIFVAFLVGYGIMRLLPAFNIVPKYEVFPATQKSLLLYSPNFLAMILVFATVGVVYWVLRKIFSQKQPSEQAWELRHALHAVGLAGIIFLAFIANSNLAVLLLLPPAYFWTAIRANRKKSDRMVNFFLLLAGTITVIIMAIVMSSIFHLGVIYWYIFLAATYGLFSVYSVVLFFMALTIMVRIFRSFVLNRG